MTIQTKTAILFAAITASVILLLSAFIYYFTTRVAFTDFYKRLEIRAYIAARVRFEQDETSVTAYSDIRREHLEILPGEKEYFVLVDSSVDKISTKAGVDLPETFFRSAVRQGAAYYTRQGFYYTGIYYPDNEGNFIVIIAATNESLANAMENLRNSLIIAFVAGTLVVFATAFVFSKYTFQPVRNIIRRVKNINAENLSLRLPEQKGKDEISELAYTFNEMLDRLQTSFETQNNFVSNASHEFRTPITTILGEADLVMSGHRSPEEVRKSVSTILSQALKMQHISNSLLNLAQTGFDGKKQDWTLLRIDELLWEVKTGVEEITSDNTVELHFENLPDSPEELIVFGSLQLLKLAFSNIILNGCKYSNNQPVIVQLRIVEDYIHVTVTDQGIGIPSSELPHVFEPFFRASNSQRFQGYGIGLPLSLNIIRLHHGMIQINSGEDRGTSVLVALPINPQ